MIAGTVRHNACPARSVTVRGTGSRADGNPSRGGSHNSRRLGAKTKIATNSPIGENPTCAPLSSEHRRGLSRRPAPPQRSRRHKSNGEPPTPSRACFSAPGTSGPHARDLNGSATALMNDEGPRSLCFHGIEGLHLVTAVQWRWGESNPRPSLGKCGFSGRSLCRRSARLRPLSQTPKSTSPAPEESRVTSRRRHAANPLNDAGIRSGNTYGPTDYRARLCSEGEVSALGFGTYCFAEIVNEITLHPRPASRRITSDVETDHPRGPPSEGPLSHCGVANPAAEAPEPYRL